MAMGVPADLSPARSSNYVLSYRRRRPKVTRFRSHFGVLVRDTSSPIPHDWTISPIRHVRPRTAVKPDRENDPRPVVSPVPPIPPVVCVPVIRSVGVFANDVPAPSIRPILRFCLSRGHEEKCEDRKTDHQKLFHKNPKASKYFFRESNVISFWRETA